MASLSLLSVPESFVRSEWSGGGGEMPPVWRSVDKGMILWYPPTHQGIHKESSFVQDFPVRVFILGGFHGSF